MSSPKVYAERSESHAQLLALYENTSKNIENIKQRSWYAFYLFVLIQSYLISLLGKEGSIVQRNIINENITVLEILGVITSLIFYLIGLSLKEGSDKFRRRLDRIYAKFSMDFRACRGSGNANSNDFGDSFIWWLLVLTYIVSFVMWVYFL